MASNGNITNLIHCETCGAGNLPRSSRCCQCGRPFGVPLLEDKALREVEDLIRKAAKHNDDGHLLITEGSGFTTEGREINLSIWPAALAHPHMGTERGLNRAVYRNARVMVVNGVLRTIRTVNPFLERIASEGEPLIIVAAEFQADALEKLLDYHNTGEFPCAALELTPPTGIHPAVLKDIATVLDTRPISPAGMRTVDMDNLPVVHEIFMDHRATLMPVERARDANRLGNDPKVANIRQLIHGVQAIRVDIGGDRRDEIRARVRHALDVLVSMRP